MVAEFLPRPQLFNLFELVCQAARATRRLPLVVGVLAFLRRTASSAPSLRAPGGSTSRIRPRFSRLVCCRRRGNVSRCLPVRLMRLRRQMSRPAPIVHLIVQHGLAISPMPKLLPCTWRLWCSSSLHSQSWCRGRCSRQLQVKCPGLLCRSDCAWRYPFV